jgi:imidazolonepropionase-like amidohydrolase
VKTGRVITRAGPDIEKGVIVIEGKKITAVGPESEVQIPWDAEVLDVPELVAFPGFVEAHSARGMDRPNENIDVAPFLDIRDSIDPVNFYFEDALRGGITAINVQQGNACVIGGMGMIVHPWGMTVEEMLVRPNAGLKLSASPKPGKSRATQAQALRRAFGDLRNYLAELVQEKKDGNDRSRREALYQGRDLEGEKSKGRAMTGSGWKVDGLELVPRGEIDDKQEPLLAVVEGRVPVWFYCGSPGEVGIAISIAKENGFLEKTVLVLGDSCWKAADEIKAAGVPVVLPTTLVYIERDPVTGEEKETFVPGVFRDKGIRFALQSTGDSMQALWFQAAMCVGYGLTREEALAAVTTTPAEILGLSDRVGALAPGHDGDVVLFSGDPLSVKSFVEYVVIGGQLVYDRSKDVRVKHLLEGLEPKNTTPSGAETQAAGDGDDDEGSGNDAEKKDEEKKKEDKKDEKGGGAR